VESDPIGLRGGISTYAYAVLNPIGRTDRFGLESPTFSTHGTDPITFGRRRDRAMDILWETFDEMEEKNVGGTDQFFHCLAACRASKSTNDPELVLDLMNLKEGSDYSRNVAGKYGSRQLSHSEMVDDMAIDRAANSQGAMCPLGVDCNTQCSSLLNNLAPHKRKYMTKYRDKW